MSAAISYPPTYPQSSTSSSVSDALAEFERAIDFAEQAWPTATPEEKRAAATELRTVLFIYVQIARAPELELTTRERTLLASLVQRGREMVRCSIARVP